MSSKSIRNGILTLIILAIGIKLIFYITSRYVDIAAAKEIGQSFSEMGDLVIYGAAGIAVILIPFYLSARSNEKKKLSDELKEIKDENKEYKK